MSSINNTRHVTPGISSTGETPAPNGAQVDSPQAAMLQGIVAGNCGNADFDQRLIELAPMALGNVARAEPIEFPLSAIIGKLEDIPLQSGHTNKFVTLGGRPIAAVKIGAVRVPFYVSTGQGRKTYVEPGKWYPLLGISHKGWFNKTPEMKNYYDSPKLRKVAEQLNREIGDIRGKELPSAEENNESEIAGFLNDDMTPIEPGEKGGRDHIESAAYLIEKGKSPYKETASFSFF